MTDETNDTGQDKLRGTERSSGKGKGSTSKGKVSITKDEYEKLLEESKASGGRAQKVSALERERDILKDRLETTNSRLDKLERQIEESRIAEARDDPSAYRTYQREHDLVKRERAVEDRESDLDRREQQLKDDRADVDKDRSFVSVAYVAAKHGLETEELEELGISDMETLDKVAEKIASAKPKETETGGEGEEGKEGEEEVGESTFLSDAGEGTGGGGVEPLTPDGLERMSMASLEKAIEKAEKSK